jgi:outer membrane lipoprotein-sorting protein
MALILALTVAAGFAGDDAATTALERFAAGWAKVQTMTYRLEKRERLRSGEVRNEEVRGKLKKPMSLYLLALKPASGQEVIYVRQRNPQQIVVHPGTFPDVTLNLDVHGSLATAGQRHPVYHSGFEYTLGAVQRAVAVAAAEPRGERLEHVREDRFDGRVVDIVRLHAGGRAPSRQRAKDGETVFSFGKRVGMDPYAIFMNNPSIDEVSDELDEGEEYVVPAYYTAVMELWLDREHGLPLLQLATDESGAVVERYAYRDLVLNPALTDADFDPDNPAYDF